jgi:protein SCO1/2
VSALHCRILASILLVAALAGAAAERPLPGDSTYQLPAQLTDSGGRGVEWRELRGRPRIATMFYTSCRYICPLTVDSLRAIERALSPAERDRIGFVLITMDPARDTPARLAEVKSERHLESAAWRLLRPEPQDLRGLAGILGIRYRSLADGEFNHTTVLVLLDDEGRVLARTERVGGSPDPEFMAAVHAAARPGMR